MLTVLIYRLLGVIEFSIYIGCMGILDEATGQNGEP